MDYELTIIGAGWAGFNAALKAKELGLEVCLIEKEEIGGTCLNRGCIPTKALIQSAEIYSLTQKSASFGIETLNPAFNFLKAQQRKERVVQGLRRGMRDMLGGIEYLNGPAQVLSDTQVRIGSRTINTRFMLIAAGSRPLELETLKFDRKKIIYSDDALNLKEIPASLLIIGGGVIGCEFASLFSRLGSKVTIIEKLPRLLPGLDQDLAKKIENIFKKTGIKVNTACDAQQINTENYDFILVCVGRAPDTRNLGLGNAGVKLEKDKILVDDYLRTNIANIYAAGDCTGKIMLAHFAAYQGRIAAGNCARLNQPRRADNQCIPNCIFTEPQIANVGLNALEAAQRGIEAVVNKFDFLGSGMARILDQTEGFIKIVSDKKTGRLLGGSIIGPKACELINILTLAVSTSLKLQELRDTIFAHPSLAESIQEAL